MHAGTVTTPGKLICTSSTHYICYFNEQRLQPLFSTWHGRAQCGVIGFYESEVRCGVRAKWLATLGLGCTKQWGRGFYPVMSRFIIGAIMCTHSINNILSKIPAWDTSKQINYFLNFFLDSKRKKKHACPHPRVSWQWPNYVTKQRGLRSSY